MPLDLELPLELQPLLEAMPSAAALIDAGGAVCLANTVWLARAAGARDAYPFVAPGHSWMAAGTRAIERGVSCASALTEAAVVLLRGVTSPFEANCAIPVEDAPASAFASLTVSVRMARLSTDARRTLLLVTVTDAPVSEHAERQFLHGLQQELSALPDAESGKQRKPDTPWAHVAFTLDSMSDAFCAVDDHWRIVWLNRRGKRLADAIGATLNNNGFQSLLDAMPWLVDSPLRHAAERAKREQRPMEVVQTFYPSERQFRVRVVPTGQGLGLFARELVDEVTVVAAQAAYEERSRSLFDAVPAPLFVFRLDTLQLLAVNPAAVQRTGWSRDALLTMQALDVVAPEERERLQVSLATPAGSLAARGEWRFRRRGGAPFVADVVVSDLTFEGVAARLVMFRDITVERGIEAELRLLREGVARLNDVLVMTDATPEENGCLRITFVNEAFERRTGWTPEETIGQTTALLDGPGTSFDTLGRIRQAIAQGVPVREEILQYTKDGREYWVELDATPVFDADGVHTHWIAVHRDITDRRRLEEQLFQAQKMDAVGRLAGGVAHDFNNVLTAISGFSELLLEELPEGSGPHEEVLQIKAASDRAAALTRQLLAFSRKQILRPRRVDLNAQVAQMEPFIRRVISAEVAIRTTFADDVPAVFADPVQFEQVLLNLVVNASEAMTTGGVLSIETGSSTLSESYAARHHGVTPGRYACLIVSDNGVGMDRRTRERAFEPFFTTKSGGTGLGLSTVYGIVQQSGGHVWVYSEPGVGTTFKIYLPMAVGAIDEIVPAAPRAAVGGTETILVVEDEPMVRDVTRAMLQRRGYQVLLAADGEQALRVARQHSGAIHLLLTDVVMPKANGRRVAEQLSMARPGLRVLFMSGYTEDAIVHHGVLEPGIALIEKPFTDLALARRVRELLDV